MNTPSHLIINAALRKGVVGQSGMEIPRSAFLLGAVLPDIPLWLLWMGAYAYYRYGLGDLSITLMDSRFDRLYFTDPFWLAAHNLLHAPLLQFTMLALLWRSRNRAGTRRWWWFWFAAGCLIHTVLDIPVHVDDGPLLFFPFEWSMRFHSPLSYWGSRHFGREFTIFEVLLDIGLLIYLFGHGFWRRLRCQSAVPPE